VKDLAAHLNITKASELRACSFCTQQPIDPWKVTCGHVYCEECLALLEDDAGERGWDRARCRECSLDIVLKEQLMRTAQEGAELSWLESKENILPSGKTLAIKAQVVSSLTSIHIQRQFRH
jgi:hypothetical protein